MYFMTKKMLTFVQTPKEGLSFAMTTYLNLFVKLLIFLYIQNTKACLSINNVNNNSKNKLRSGVSYYIINLKMSMLFTEQIVTIYNKLLF